MYRNNLITYLNNYWIKRNVLFGDQIHQLQPLDVKDWRSYLKRNNYFLLSQDYLASLGFKEQDTKAWINYISNSFWNLYTSEIKAIQYFKEEFGLEIKRVTNYSLERFYGIDFEVRHNNIPCFILVKKLADKPKLIKSKQLKYFAWGGFNNANSKLFLFESNIAKLWQFDADKCEFVANTYFNHRQV